MKCSKCGKRCNSLPAMAKHYRKKHPAAMKRGKTSRKGGPKMLRSELPPTMRARFCPHCGGFLG